MSSRLSFLRHYHQRWRYQITKSPSTAHFPLLLIEEDTALCDNVNMPCLPHELTDLTEMKATGVSWRFGHHLLALIASVFVKVAFDKSLALPIL